MSSRYGPVEYRTRSSLRAARRSRMAYMVSLGCADLERGLLYGRWWSRARSLRLSVFLVREGLAVHLRNIEASYLDSLIRDGDLSPFEADSLRRLTPTHRDAFDSLLFTTTRVAFDEGDWEQFCYAVSSYMTVIGGPDVRPPELIPPATATAVADILAQYRSQCQPGEPLYNGSHRLTVHNQQLAEQLMATLGDGFDDGIHIAGKRTFSRMISARISDGFIHPALGAHLWAEYPTGRSHPITGGRHISVMRTMGALSQAWASNPTERPKIERMILDRAHTRGWTADSPFADDPQSHQGSVWYAHPPIAD